jgi:hypothetical protein
MHGKSLWEIATMTQRNNAPFWKSILWYSAFLCVLANARMVTATLSQLVRDSPVVVFGHFRQIVDHPAASSDATVEFDIVEVLKGKPRTKLSLCNYHPDSEWPDLSRLNGDYVLFAEPDGTCERLTLGYRSLTPVVNRVANTSGIEDEPARQPIQKFLMRLRALVKHQSSRSD